MNIRSVPAVGTIDYIEFNDGRVLGLSNDNTRVVIEPKDDVKTTQQWVLPLKDKDGYFVLRNQNSRTYLTATSPAETTVEGNG